MRRGHLVFGLVLLLVLAGCSQDRISAPDGSSTAGFDAGIAATQIVRATGWETAEDAALPDRLISLETSDLPQAISNFNRECLGGDIYHYSFDVSVGPGQYDVIRLHRVVREQRPSSPIRSAKTIFLLHGDAVGFVKFLFGFATPHAPDDHALAIYLAAHDVDVWGIDQNWVLVPEGVSDFAFMNAWDMQNQVDNVLAGMMVARNIRLMTGNGFNKMPLLGYSSGVWTGYACLNQETQLPVGHRSIKGFIAADGAFKLDPSNAAGIAANCDYVAFAEGNLDAGIYQDETGIAFALVGYLAEMDPGGASPVFPGLTNLDTFFLFGCQTYLLFYFNDWFHYFSPVYEDGAIVGLNDTPLSWAEDFVQTASPYESMRFLLDYSVIICDQTDVPYDDHLAEIRVPVLCLAPAGGFGSSAYYTLGLLGSTDITIHEIRLQPPGQEALDFGHIDLWTAPNAPQLVWQPILDWITDHPSQGNGRPGGGHVAQGQ